MPTEILIKIARWVARDTLVSFGNPETRPELEYITNSGEPQHYQSWSHYILEYRHFRIYFPSILGKADTHHDKSICSLSHTCVRLFRACQVVLFHTAIIRLDNHRLGSFLKTMTREETARLQRYVACLAVTYDFTVTNSMRTTPSWPREPMRINAIENTLASGTVRLQLLRSLDLNDEGRGKIRPDCWYSLLPTLPSLEHLTLRNFEEVDGDLPFPELPRLEAVHFYHCGRRYSQVSHFITKSLLERLPSLRTLACHGDSDPCLPDALEPVRDVLQTLAWVNDRCYLDHGGGPDIACLRRLRHVKTGFFREYLWDGTQRTSLCNEKALARMESLETVEVIASPSYLHTLEAITAPFRRIMETFSRSKNAGGFKGLRVVDLRSFESWNFSTAEWKAMGDEFLDTEIREYEQLGVKLLLPEVAGCSSPEDGRDC
ncbi:hypothetical protein LY76DRAFT_615636 [Colletotrichum caudatum]|nr:hypothetical protein LY76DRAFT_615636 [Colletotrichum caudatum]